MGDNGRKSTVRKRVEKLLDFGSFVEVGGLVTARSTDFNMTGKSTPADGVITGYGTMNGELVYVYGQDSTVLGGTLGEMHARKIAGVYDMAVKMGAPVIGLVDSAGMRLQEATDALEALGCWYHKSIMASGVIPQIVGVFGGCGGGLSVAAAVSDFTFVESTQGRIFVNSPDSIPGNCKEKTDTSKADFQFRETGIVDDVGYEDELLRKIRDLISVIPPNNEERAVDDVCNDELNRMCDHLADMAEDTAAVLSELSDGGVFIEVKKGYARDMVTGFVKLNGMTVGAVANRVGELDEEGAMRSISDGSLTERGAGKAAEFVRFCDAFRIPVLSLTNVKGFSASSCGEKNIARSTAKMIAAFADATVPKVNVIIGKAYGSAYVAMNSKSIGADMVYAWPNAEIGMMDAKLAAQIMYEGATPEEISEKAREYRELQSSPVSAARRGYVDRIISPEETRKYLIGAFEMLFTKKESHPYKKHGTV